MTLADRLARVAQTTDRWVGWFRLPKPLGLAVLIGLREQLRADNLYDAFDFKQTARSFVTIKAPPFVPSSDTVTGVPDEEDPDR